MLSFSHVPNKPYDIDEQHYKVYLLYDQQKTAFIIPKINEDDNITTAYLNRLNSFRNLENPTKTLKERINCYHDAFGGQQLFFL